MKSFNPNWRFRPEHDLASGSTRHVLLCSQAPAQGVDVKTLLKAVVFVLAVLSTSLVFAQTWQAPMQGSSSASQSPGNGLASLEFRNSSLKTTIYFGGLGSRPTQVFILCCDTEIKSARRAMKALSAVLGPDYGDSNVIYDTDNPAIWDDNFIGTGTAAQATTKLLDGLQRG